MNKNNTILYLGIFVIVQLGCNPLALFPNPARDRIYKEQFERYSEWRSKELSKLQRYVGYTKQAIKSMFGSPDSIMTYSDGERWEYNQHEREKGIYAFRFYFRGDRVYKVDVF